MKNAHFFTILAAFCSISLALPQTVSARAPKISQGIDEDAQLPYWQMENGVISVRIVQRLPDQSRGYFMARGFNREHSEFIAGHCVFQTVVRNLSPKTQPIVVRYDIRDWRGQTTKGSKPIITREMWDQIWQAKNLSTRSAIAFTWSLLPTQQEYQAGDYNWGMSMLEYAPGTRFSLHLKWKENEQPHEFTIADIACAADIAMDPKE